MYWDPRFLPADQFHAGCAQEAQIWFEGKEKNISKIHIELEYIPSDMEITRIVWLNQIIANYRIEYDRIVFDIDNPVTDSKTALFKIDFKSKDMVTQTNLLVATGSYFVANQKISYLQNDVALSFAKVPECAPDSTAPSVSLIFPTSTSDKIALDQYFIFEIKDADKWIDKQSVKILLDDTLYSSDSDALKRKGKYLTFYPKEWLWINKKVTIQASVWDLQRYGWTNTTEKIFSFKTATGIVLLDAISPATLRRLAKDAKNMAASAEECALLQNFHERSDTSFQDIIVPIMEKMSCPVEISEGWSIDLVHGSAWEDTAKKTKLNFISVFAALGWILFAVTLVLKFHYMASYKKHKKLANMYKNN